MNLTKRLSLKFVVEIVIFVVCFVICMLHVSFDVDLFNVPYCFIVRSVWLL